MQPLSHPWCLDDYVIPSDLRSGLKTRIYSIEDVFCQGAYGAVVTPVCDAVGAGHLISPELQYCYHPLPGFPTLIRHVPSGYVHLRQLDRDLSSTLV